MSILVNWESANTIQLEFEPGWTWDQLNAAIVEADAMITSVDYPVHLLIDIRNAGGLPGDFLTRAKDIFAQGEARANEGQRIVIGAGRLLRMAYGSLVAVYGQQLAERPFLFANDLEEAQRLLTSTPNA